MLEVTGYPGKHSLTTLHVVPYQTKTISIETTVRKLMFRYRIYENEYGEMVLV
jgi:hypothetical protein